MKDTDEGVNYEAIAEKVVKIAPKGKKGGHPNRNAIRKLIERMDGDDEWFPGKRPEAAYGRPATLTPAKRKASGTHLSDNDVCVQGWQWENLWESAPRMCLSKDGCEKTCARGSLDGLAGRRVLERSKDVSGTPRIRLAQLTGCSFESTLIALLNGRLLRAP